MDKFLRQQGLNGNPYKFLYGDIKEMIQMITNAKLKPINLTDDIVPRVMPFIHNSIKTHEGNPLTKLLARGVASAEADQWVKHIKILNPAFRVEKLKDMLPAFYVSCTFGSSFEEGRKIFELQTEQAQLVINAIQSMYIPGSRFLPTKNNRRLKENDRVVKATIKKIINKRMTAMKAGESSSNDLLGILLDSNDKEIKQQGNKIFGLGVDEVIQECKLLYFAGQETTSNLLAWTMILLGQHTIWQERARDEVLKVFGERKPDIDGLSHLKVITMIFHEVLRLYPPGISIRRMNHEEITLGNITLPAGSFLELHILLLHHDSDIWGNDVNDFKPERFVGVPKEANALASYMPFGVGTRICIGKNFATMEAKLALVMILRRFCFELSPSYAHAPHSIMTLQPQLGAQLILHKL
ncbi:hypothetical protein LXL04_025602 [Taraxacum kok-saghyz]